MKSILKEAWSYAILLIILFVIAALAVSETIDFIKNLVSPEDYRVITTLVWTTTLGFMFIAGAFGLWAIQLSAESEGQRRISRFVDAMDYITDSLLIVDRKGKITGSNPKAKEMTGAELSSTEYLRDIFPCISEEEALSLAKSNKPEEMEKQMTLEDSTRLLRFRSMPTEGLALIMISDITDMEAKRRQKKYDARLQLIGQLAKAVANDFNNLLCGISTHAAVLSRLIPETDKSFPSISAISNNADKGIALSHKLLQMTQPAATSNLHSNNAPEHVKLAVRNLESSLAEGWHISCDLHDQPRTVSLAGDQIEQIVLNAGLLAADELKNPGYLKIETANPEEGTFLLDVDSNFSTLIIVSASKNNKSIINIPSGDLKKSEQENGILHSFISSILEEADGFFDKFVSCDGTLIYRLALPATWISYEKKDDETVSDELRSYVSEWKMLLAHNDNEPEQASRVMTNSGADVKITKDIASALAYVESAEKLDVMIFDKYLLGQEARGLLKAIIKLRPSAGLVVLCDNPESEPDELQAEIIFLTSNSSEGRILRAVMESKSLAAKRSSTQKG